MDHSRPMDPISQSLVSIQLPAEGKQGIRSESNPPPEYLLNVAQNPVNTNHESPEKIPFQTATKDLSIIIEALLFAAEDPPTISTLAKITNTSKDSVDKAIKTLQTDAIKRGIRIQRDDIHVRLVTAPEATTYIEQLLGLERPNRLSKAALETIAIIAYQQPLTRSAIEAVRGVSCDAPLNTLRNRELIESVGQADTPGRPHLWTTTMRFLDHFGLSHLDELPALPNLTEDGNKRGKLNLLAQSKPPLATSIQDLG